MLNNPLYRPGIVISLILMPVVMTILITGAAYLMGTAVGAPDKGAAAAAVTFVIAGTWLCGAALGICDRVAMRSLELQQARFEAALPAPKLPQLYNQIIEPVRVPVTPNNTVFVQIPEGITRTMMQEFAHGVLVAHTPIAGREWYGDGKTFTRPKWDKLIPEMEQRDLLRLKYVNNRAGGFELTGAGETFLMQFLPPAPRARMWYEKTHTPYTHAHSTHADKWVSG